MHIDVSKTSALINLPSSNIHQTCRAFIRYPPTFTTCVYATASKHYSWGGGGEGDGIEQKIWLLESPNH